MRIRNKKTSGLAFWVMLVMMLATIAAIILVNLFWLDRAGWKTLAMELMSSLLSAITISLIIGTFTKIISEHLFAVKRNDRKLASFGIQQISTGISTTKDVLDLFGNPYKKQYPKEICLLFITGNSFFKVFQHEIIHCLQRGCCIKVMLASPHEANFDFLKRMEQLCPQKTSCANQISQETLPLVEKIRKEAGNTEGRIMVRFYRDEYRYNYRSARYLIGENELQTNYWINISPPNTDAVDLSVVLKGCAYSTEEIQNSIFEKTDKSFSFLWEKYRSTEY